MIHQCVNIVKGLESKATPFYKGSRFGGHSKFDFKCREVIEYCVKCNDELQNR